MTRYSTVQQKQNIHVDMISPEMVEKIREVDVCGTGEKDKRKSVRKEGGYGKMRYCSGSAVGWENLDVQEWISVSTNEGCRSVRSGGT